MNQLMGYRRNGQVGFRNHILVIPSVFCSNKVCEDIAEGIDGVTAIDHAQGCGQIGADLEQTKRTLIGTALNPNVYGVIIVGLGCEDAAAEEIAARIKQLSTKPVYVFTIQYLGDTHTATEKGKELALEMLTETKMLTREPVNLNELKIGLIPNQIEELTRHTSAVLMQSFAEKLLKNRAIVVYGDYNEIYPALDRLCSISSPTIQQLLLSLERDTNYELSGEVYLEDFIARDFPITDVIEYAEQIRSHSGLVYMHGPNHNLEQATGLSASGVHLIIVGTSEGSVLGSPATPILTISASDELYNIIGGDLDFNAGTLLENPQRLPIELESFTNLVINTLNETPSKSEEIGIIDFGIQRIGPSI